MAHWICLVVFLPLAPSVSLPAQSLYIVMMSLSFKSFFLLCERFSNIKSTQLNVHNRKTSRCPVSFTDISFIMVIFGENTLLVIGGILLQYCKWSLGKIGCKAEQHSWGSDVTSDSTPYLNDFSGLCILKFVHLLCSLYYLLQYTRQFWQTGAPKCFFNPIVTSPLAVRYSASWFKSQSNLLHVEDTELLVSGYTELKS